MRLIACLHQRGGFEIVLAGVFEWRAVDHAIDEVPLEGVNAVAGEAFTRVRILAPTRRLAEELEREVAFEIEFEVAFAAVNADGAFRLRPSRSSLHCRRIAPAAEHAG
jgi:hypothetical protein